MWLLLQTVVDTAGNLFTEVQDEASFLSASEEIEKFALKYAASHLQNGTAMNFISGNLGKIPITPLIRQFLRQRMVERKHC